LSIAAENIIVTYIFKIKTTIDNKIKEIHNPSFTEQNPTIFESDPIQLSVTCNYDSSIIYPS